MILKGSQRAGASQLAAHLLNDRDNDHVRVYELRGFAAGDLHGALTEAHAVSRGTKCRQYMFSLSLNPPKGAEVGEADFEAAADEAEKRLGLGGQPRAIVIHEKEGRRHAHVVWSRIDAEQMRAINLPHFKLKLTTLSRELFLDHEWALPDGLRTNGGRSPLNFTLDEWQQAKRIGRDPREIKDAIRDAWARSDSLKSLTRALEDRGYVLAQGDRRGFVVVDTDGEVFALARGAGIKTREVRDKLGAPDALPTVDDVKRDLAHRTAPQLRAFIGALRQRQAHELVKARAPMAAITAAHRAERVDLSAQQSERWAHETRERAARFRAGLAGVWDTLSGKRRVIRRQNEADAIEALARDRAQRDALFAEHMRQRDPLQTQLDHTRQRHVQERQLLARTVADHRRRLARRDHATAEAPERVTPRRTRRGPSLDL